MFKIIDNIELVTVQLEKAHSILNTLSDFFEREDDIDDLQRKAKDISNLIISANDYVEDATVSAVAALSRAQEIVNADLSEIERILREHFEQQAQETPEEPNKPEEPETTEQ